MVCQYTLTLQDFQDAQRTWYRSTRFGALRRALWVWIAPACGIIAAALLLYDTVVRHFQFSPLVGGILAGAAWFGLFILVMRPINIRRAYRQMMNGRPASSPIELEIAGDELISRLPGLSEGRFRRAAIISTAEDDRMMLLFVAKKRFLILPKREVSSENLQAVRDWLLRRSDA